MYFFDISYSYIARISYIQFSRRRPRPRHRSETSPPMHSELPQMHAFSLGSPQAGVRLMNSRRVLQLMNSKTSSKNMFGRGMLKSINPKSIAKRAPRRALVFSFLEPRAQRRVFVLENWNFRSLIRKCCLV